MKVILIIPHYGEDSDLKRCLKSVRTMKHDAKLIEYVVDNNKKNIGFTAAVNQGIREHRDADFYWILNNDTEVQKDTLSELLKAAKKYKGAGIIASQLLHMQNRDTIVWGGSLAVIPGIHKSGSLSLDQLQKPSWERWATFGSVLLRREMVEEIGLLDERFFLICSDSDYCFTARSRGWKVLHWPKSKVFHDEEEGVSRASNPDRDAKRLSVLWNDQRLFQDKWMNGRLFFELEKEVTGYP